eukprot:SAG22_NODE_9629_length_578_cov_1.615866_1_plen_111_part_10
MSTMLAISLLLAASGGLLRLAEASGPAFRPILFMDPATDALDPWGLQTGAPSALTRNSSLSPPPGNYSAGATVFAAFSTGATGSYEVFVAAGRPGEPLLPREPAAAAGPAA